MEANTYTLARRCAAEFVGTALLLVAVVGSGIMAEKLSEGNVALALLANSLATGAALFALILMFAPRSGAHFNPVVSLADFLDRRLSVPEFFSYIMAQMAGGFLGVWITHIMFNLPVFMVSYRVRAGSGQWLAEWVATFGLVIVIRFLRVYSIPVTAGAVGLYIMGAYWFTSSTSFANPAVTLARMATDTFAGIRPGDAAPFIMAQIFGCLSAVAFSRWFEEGKK